MNANEVILVDERDSAIGTMEKMEAHEKGLLHRAFSVFLFNDRGEMLLQRRALEKYHSPGLWTNTCCSHPMQNESVEIAANRRLMEEMGMECTLSKAFDFIYRAELENNMIEHEFDHVFIGLTNQIPRINTAEVCEWKWTPLYDVYIDVQINPSRYTEWFKIALPEVMAHVKLHMS
jgi:isopentenyl-diphosphate delta-isomerase